MNVDSSLTAGGTIMKKRVSRSIVLIAFFFILAMRYFTLPIVKIGGGASLRLDAFLFFFLFVSSLFVFLMRRKEIERELLFAFLLPGVGLLYLGYGYFIAHNDAHRAFFEYQPFMFYLSAMFPLILLRVETDAEYVLKVIVYSGLAYLPILLLQFFILKMTGIIFLPGVEDIGKEWLGATGRFVPDAQDVVLLVSIYLYWKVVRELNARNLIAAVLSVVALLLTYSRGLWLSYVIGFVFVSWHEKRFFLKRFHTLPLLAAACGAVVIFIYMSGLSDSILHRFGMMSTSAVSTDMSLKWRVYEIKEAIRAIEASPVIGHGLGYEYHRPFAFVSDSFYFHNNYLFLLVKMGLPGFLAMLAFIVVFIKTALAVYKEYAGNNLVSGVAIASAAYMTAMSFAVMARSAFVTTTNTVALISVIFGVFAFLRIHKRRTDMAAKAGSTR